MIAAIELQRILVQLDGDLRRLTATVQLLAQSVALGMAAPASPAAGPAPPTPAGVRTEPQRWALRDHGWTLMSPEGKALTLTTAEREFMASLLAAPDHRMARTELPAREGTHESRGLDVMVSRLRRKARIAGVRLPLRSVRRWGYMFTADADIA